MQKPVFIVGAARTPIGAFQGALAEVSAVQLGSAAIRAAVERASVSVDMIDETWMGMVLTAGVGQAPARQAAKGAGVPDKVPATTVGKVCGSGLHAVTLAVKSVLLGDAKIAIGGGMESMSNAPYLLQKGRTGYRMGHGQLIDEMIQDGLWDPYNNFHMGMAGELCAREFSLSRGEQDAYAAESYRRAQQAQKDGAFRAEIAAVNVPGKKGDTLVEDDEQPSKVNFDKMASLKPVFDKNGTITAANASPVNDGAAALILASEDAVNSLGLKPLARIVSYAGHAQAPEWFTTAPVGAIEHVCARAGLKTGDIDLFEINEAFSVVPMACAQKISVPLEKTNVRGGSVALGHPIGASGARILVTLVHALRDKKLKRGLATLCLGGGEAVAMIVETV